ncbi:DUF3859 domain-containing protein [Rhodophyticola sp. CCM32]|uniref:DUF3859 domain-containing protein n=1 Tax=Rhodophyticola sp. CCM32 TaxID=2916397 RepID=UPI00107F6B4E|nr:DUF3859 domain-containing protein [Rhodophyticola sp. CCM32]QBY02301.1 DUF3859 domain-containing protein [Rhodophyticola sp. CCM32]
MRWQGAGLRACVLAAALACIAPGFPALAQPDDDNPVIGPGIARLEYGVYCAQEPDATEEAPGTAAGVVNLVSEIPAIRWPQFQVPADIGIGFGVIIETGDDRVLDPVIITVTHPPFPDSGIEVEQWLTRIDGQSPSLHGFSFEYEAERVPGDWTFSASYKGQELYHVTFQVLPGTAMPEFALTCMGGAVS